MIPQQASLFPNLRSWWDIPSQELAYVFGFAFADGGTNRSNKTGRQVCHLVFSQADREILDQMRVFIPGVRIRKVLDRGRVWWVARIGRSDGLTVSTMKQWGIVPNKTAEGYWPPKLAPEFMPHYIRGYFDGDGWISGHTRGQGKSMAWVVGFVCHLPDYLEKLQASLESLGVSGGYLVKDGRNYRLRYSRHEQIARFVDAIYHDATLYITRKREVAEQFKEYYATRERRAGEMHHNSVLTANDVRLMRALRERGHTLKELSARFGTTKTNVSLICLRKAWTHIE